MPAFELHPRLAADHPVVGDWPLCRVLLGNDQAYPWFILVPRRADLREIYELPAAERQTLLEESCLLGEAMMRAYDGYKLNVAALGNVVPQLHLHHLVRRPDDAAWPAPVWGRAPPVPYEAPARQARLQALNRVLPAAYTLQGE